MERQEKAKPMLSLSKLIECFLSARPFCGVLGTVMHQTDVVPDSWRRKHYLQHRGYLQILLKKNFTIQKNMQKSSCQDNVKGEIGFRREARHPLGREELN